MSTNAASTNAAGADSGESANTASSQSSVQISVQTGIQNVWKLGYPTRHVVQIKSGNNAAQGTVVVDTFDGDGVPVSYSNQAWKVDLAPNASTQLETVARHGRSNRPIAIRILGNDGKEITRHVLTTEERGQTLPATQPLVVGIGSDLKLGMATLLSARGQLPDFSAIEIQNAADLPVHPECYEAVNLLFLSSSNTSLMSDWTKEQCSAIRQWTEQGGRCVLTLGKNTKAALQSSDIASMIPGSLVNVVQDGDPGPLESLLGSQQQLKKLECALFQLDAGSNELMSSTANRTRFPLIAKWAYGMGRVQLLATELDSPELMAWDSRIPLLKSFMKDQWEASDGRPPKIIHQSYDDLTGQLNATLDRFPRLKNGNLAQMAVIAGILALILGPFDFFVVSQSWRRPRATWFTLLSCSIGGCLLIVGLVNAWKPAAPSINCIEFIDFDYQTQRVTGRGYAHCYGGKRGSFDISARHRSFSLTGNDAAGPAIQLDWFGQPGKGLGGFESTVATDRGMPAYRIETQIGTNSNSGAQASSETGTSNATNSLGAFNPPQVITGLGIPAAGTKAIIANWTEPFQVGNDVHALSTIKGRVDLLEGTFANPLDLDLHDGMLLFRGRSYTIPTRIRPNERVSIATATRDINRRLQRRQNVAGEEQTVAWDPADIYSPVRLAEIISFHRAASGQAYTSLLHRYIHSLDHSDLLRMDKAVLFAEVKDAGLGWSIARNGIPIQAIEGERRTFVRLIIPVNTGAKKPISQSVPGSTTGDKP